MTSYQPGRMCGLKTTQSPFLQIFTRTPQSWWCQHLGKT